MDQIENCVFFKRHISAKTFDRLGNKFLGHQVVTAILWKLCHSDDFLLVIVEYCLGPEQICRSRQKGCREPRLGHNGSSVVHCGSEK
jgi:hypothetical protein